MQLIAESAELSTQLRVGFGLGLGAVQRLRGCCGRGQATGVRRVVARRGLGRHHRRHRRCRSRCRHCLNTF